MCVVVLYKLVYISVRARTYIVRAALGFGDFVGGTLLPLGVASFARALTLSRRRGEGRLEGEREGGEEGRKGEREGKKKSKRGGERSGEK